MYKFPSYPILNLVAVSIATNTLFMIEPLINPTEAFSALIESFLGAIPKKIAMQKNLKVNVVHELFLCVFFQIHLHPCYHCDIYNLTKIWCTMYNKLYYLTHNIM